MLEKNFFTSLPGNWHFKRQIYGQPNAGLVTGIATIEKLTNDTLHYVEQGELYLHSQTICVEQEYLYQLSSDLQVFFSENAIKKDFFHSIKFTILKNSTAISQAEHTCLKDKYSCLYYLPTMTNIKKFMLSYTVMGPNKNYRMYSYYEKLKVE